ncbi:hypothetical protein [Leisingera sp. ANG-M1]|uniref:hypothetical protein n=1 Tax=Leisingera sp. ANG-M1 TaxID=1577895 RepID=UPI000A3DF2D4|nr:hypothetical protein [Leisingera sp. ANG-M1]
MPKVIIHLRGQHASEDLSRQFLELYGYIVRMLDSCGIEAETRVMDHDVRTGTRNTGDRRFEDGNLHIFDDRHLQMPNVLNGSMAYLPGFWHLAPQGVRCYSPIAEKPFRENMIPYKYAAQFYGKLKTKWKDGRQSRYNQSRDSTRLPKDAISVFFQGNYPREVKATSFTDISMLRDVLEGAGSHPVVVKPHPLLADVGTMVELAEIMEQDGRITLTDANIHDILAVSCATVSVNSSVAVEGFLHRTPAILYGRSDFHHMAETVTGPGQFAAALERAQTRTGGYAQFMTWYFRNNCLEIGAANLEQRIWEIFTEAGFPKERFTAG